jgi:hypothetical protein
MNKSELAELGIELAAELNDIATHYHEKSDAYDILNFEVISLRAMCHDLVEGCGVRVDLQASSLLSTWGKRLANLNPDLAKRAAHFHAQYKVAQKDVVLPALKKMQ